MHDMNANAATSTSGRGVRFARRLFLVAGIYGLIVLPPFYFLEERMGQDFPPAITHPEYYYGFVGVAIAWQVAFLIIARDPSRYRLLMIPSVIEKFSFGLAALVLFQQGRVPGTIVASGTVDLVFGVLFIVAFWRLRETS